MSCDSRTNQKSVLQRTLYDRIAYMISGIMKNSLNVSLFHGVHIEL
jgi:hypothetical protein